MTFRLAVLVSGSGTLLQALLDAIAAGACAGEVVVVGSDRAGIEGLARAERAGVPTFTHPYAKGPRGRRTPEQEDTARAEWDARLTELVAAHHPDLVVSAGFMKLVGTTFLDRFAGAMINTHPALLPSFPGMHGVRDALAYGVKVTGATVFTVDAGVDTGRILAQAPVEVRADDTEESLHERIKVAERRLLIDIVNRLATTRLATETAKEQQ